jgi:hypothetical protein
LDPALGARSIAEQYLKTENPTKRLAQIAYRLVTTEKREHKSNPISARFLSDGSFISLNRQIEPYIVSASYTVFTVHSTRDFRISERLRTGQTFILIAMMMLDCHHIRLKNR